MKRLNKGNLCKIKNASVVGISTIGISYNVENNTHYYAPAIFIKDDTVGMYLGRYGRRAKVLIGQKVMLVDRCHIVKIEKKLK